MRVRAYVGRLIPPVVFVLLLPVAFAAPVVMQRDRADNSMSFKYDSDTDHISEATSSIRYRRGDPVQFTTTVVDCTVDCEETLPLFGQITLRLNGETPVTYTGTFTFIVRGSTGDIMFQEPRDVSFTLRPRTGKRVKKLPFHFDLPTGDYSVAATFNAPE